jgi:hypothetical protein
MPRCAYWLIHSFSLVIDLIMLFTPNSSSTSLSTLTTQARRIWLSVCIYYYCKGVDDDDAPSNRSVTRVSIPCEEEWIKIIVIYALTMKLIIQQGQGQRRDDDFWRHSMECASGIENTGVVKYVYCVYRSSAGNGLAMDSAIQEQLAVPEITSMYRSSM